LLTVSVVTAADKPVHLFILSGQSNMAGMDPETGFMPEAKKLFKDEKVVYIKVAKRAQPICRWLEEWDDIAKENGLTEKNRERLWKDKGVTLYQPILDQYKEMLKKHPKPASVTFCWMQGERDANGGGQPAYKDALKALITKLRRDLERPDMNIVIGRLSDAGQKKESWGAMRKIQMEIVNEDPSGAWVDCDDLNDKMKDGKTQNAVHYERPEGYITLGRRFARQGYALIKGKKPAEDGRPGHREPKEREKKEGSKAREDKSTPRNGK
nr:sialate O-acetylesterase [Dehalococcoidia bacterium]